MKRFPSNLLIISALGPALVAISSAQNTSPLDSAPGAENAPAVTTNAPTLTPSAPVAAATAPAVSTSPAASADTGTSLLSNPDFSQETRDPNWPDDWGHPAPGLTLETEGGAHFLRLVQQTPGKLLMAYREMKIPEGTKGIKITIRYRTAGIVHGKQNWMDARAVFHFMDASRKQIKPEPRVIGFSVNAATWTESSVTAPVPDGATTLVLMPSLFMANAGTLDLAEVQVTAMGDADVATMNAAAAAAQKTSDANNAYIAQQLALPATTQELKVSGNQLVTPDGKSVWLQGVNVPELSWSPNGENKVVWSVHLAIDDWHANVIRLPVMDTFWFGKGRGDQPSNNADAYRQIVDDAVKLASTRGAYIVLDLHRFLTPDQSCVDFWKDAAARYKNNPAVLFDIFNEPHGISWDVWQKGGPVVLKAKDGTSTTVQGVGMQALVDAVRGTGAKNIIVAGGLEYAYDLTGILNGYALDDKGGNGIMYATHFYNWHKGWSAHFMAVAAKYPVLIGETGADIKKMNFIPANQQEDPSTWVPDLLGFIQKNRLNWTGWSFYTGSTPGMLSDLSNYTPNSFWGEPVKDALGGKQFEMQRER
jgi:aryl-phospho-beta-D-glucosidase BglC (GH1 family)